MSLSNVQGPLSRESESILTSFQELYALTGSQGLRNLLASEFSINLPEKEAVTSLSDQNVVQILTQIRNQVAHHLKYLPQEVTKIFSSRTVKEIVRDVDSCSQFFKVVYLYNFISFVHAFNPDIKIPTTISLACLEKAAQEAKAWLENPVNTQNICHISLVNHQLTCLPSGIDRFGQLSQLILRGTLLYTLPSTISALTKLKILDLQESKISVLPPESTSLPALNELILAKTSLETLPSALGNLHNLKVLNISETKISELPNSLGEASSLVTLNVSGTPIKNLSSILNKLTKLEDLNLSSLDIDAVPKDILSLKNLKILDISKTKIKQLPANLKTLLPRLAFFNTDVKKLR